MNLFSFFLLPVNEGLREGAVARETRLLYVVKFLKLLWQPAEWRDDLSKELCFMFCQLAYKPLYTHMCTLLSWERARNNSRQEFNITWTLLLNLPDYLQTMNTKGVRPHGVVGAVPTFQPRATRVRFSAGSGILISILGLGVCPLCSVLCRVWRRPWHSAHYRFRKIRPCVPV